METCGIITDDHFIVGTGDSKYQECVMPCGHYGPHVIRREDGVYVAFETDMECDCECCMGDEPDLWCVVYWELSDVEAQKLIEGKE